VLALTLRSSHKCHVNALCRGEKNFEPAQSTRRGKNFCLHRGWKFDRAIIAPEFFSTQPINNRWEVIPDGSKKESRKKNSQAGSKEEEVT
jgi:hypothetical protein